MRLTTHAIELVVGLSIDHHRGLHGSSTTAPVARALTQNVEVLVKDVAVAVQAHVGEVEVGHRLGEGQGPGSVGIEGDDVRRCRRRDARAFVGNSGRKVVGAAIDLDKGESDRVGQRRADSAACRREGAAHGVRGAAVHVAGPVHPFDGNGSKGRCGVLQRQRQLDVDVAVADVACRQHLAHLSLAHVAQAHQVTRSHARNRNG